MQTNKLIGMRTLKTGLAVTLCCLLTRFAVDNMFYCATACVVTMGDTIKTSYKMGFHRVYGTFIGGIVGFLLVLISPADPFLCGLGIMIVIKCCHKLKLTSIVVASVTFFSLYLGYIDSGPLAYSIQRVMDTFVGVIMGLIVNYSFARPNYYNNTMREFTQIKALFKSYVKSLVSKEEELHIENIEKRIKNVEGIYSKLIDEMNYSRKEFNLDIIDKNLDLCRQIYFHIKSIDLLEKELYLNNENYKMIKKSHKDTVINLKIDNNESPVFNFHLNKIIEKINLIDETASINN